MWDPLSRLSCVFLSVRCVSILMLTLLLFTGRSSVSFAENSTHLPSRAAARGLSAPAGVQIDARLSNPRPGQSRTTGGFVRRTLRSDYMNLQEKPLIRWHDRKRYVLVYIPLAEEMPGWSSEIPARLESAFREWEEALSENGHKRLEFLFVRDPKTYDVTVVWDGKALKTPDGDQVGESVTDTWNGYMRTNNLKLALNDSDGRPFEPDLFESNALHEIGHMLGIKNHSDDPNDVMAAVSGPGAHHLTDRDIATVRALYSRPADCANPMNIALSRFEEFKRKELKRSQQWTWVSGPSTGAIAVPTFNTWGY